MADERAVLFKPAVTELDLEHEHENEAWGKVEGKSLVDAEQPAAKSTTTTRSTYTWGVFVVAPSLSKHTAQQYDTPIKIKPADRLPNMDTNNEITGQNTRRARRSSAATRAASRAFESINLGTARVIGPNYTHQVLFFLPAPCLFHPQAPGIRPPAANDGVSEMRESLSKCLPVVQG